MLYMTLGAYLLGKPSCGPSIFFKKKKEAISIIKRFYAILFKCQGLLLIIFFYTQMQKMSPLFIIFF